MLGYRHRLLAITSGLLALAACCKNSSPITSINFSCSDLDGDVCTPGADGGPDAGGCADHTYCLPVEKSDPDYADAVGHDCNKCYLETRSCASSADCCPGQQCNLSLKLCFDCYNLDSTGACGQSDCTSDADCVTLEGPGHICVTYNSPDGGAPQIPTESATSMRCSYPTCQKDSDCTNGGSCFPENATPNGYCVPQTPCSGSCAAGTACAITDDFCSAVPEGVAACQQSCAPGTMLVFVDESVPTGVYDACNRPAVTCDCATLPPLRSDDLGRYSSLAAVSGQVWVSAYDGEYGDLVAYHFSPDGGLIDLEYVDGVPSSGPVVADPNGPRGGVAVPGPNVGEWTSLTLGGDGQPRIAYYDVDHSSLKFAQRSSSGKWTTGWVDGFDGTGASDGGDDVGSYTSIAMNAAGNPVISYFQASGPSSAPLQTALKLAVANVASPASASDWTVSVVDQANKPSPPCFPVTCTSSETCVGTPPVVDGGPTTLADGGCEPAVPPDNGGACLANSTKCGSGDAGCSGTEACVTAGDGGATCMPTFAASGFTDLVQGVGLFSSLAFDKSGDTLIAYYDRLHGDLRLAKGSAGAFTVTTVDGTDPATCEDTGNVGLFPSLKVNGTTFAIAYQDQDSEELLYWTGTAASNIAPSERVIIDTGTIQAPAPNNAEDTPMFIGANVSLAFGQSGVAYFAYQNQTQISLRLSSEPAGCGTQNPAACTVSVINEYTTDPEGFYSQVAIDGTQGYASSAQIKALANGVDDTLILQAPQSLP